jgi:hypothetical protein
MDSAQRGHDGTIYRRPRPVTREWETCRECVVQSYATPMPGRARDTGSHVARRQMSTRRNRSEFAMTETELRLMAALAIIRERSQPVKGKSSPAASGTPSAL